MDDENRDLRYSFTGTDSSFQAAAKRVSAAFDTISRKANTMSARFKTVGKGADNATNKLRKINTTSKTFNKALGKTYSVTGLVTRALRTLTGLSLGKLFADAITNSIDFAESLNMFNVAMDDLIPKATRFTNVMAELLGLDPRQIMDAMGVFQNIAKSIGVPAETAYILSENFTKLGNDLASLWNTSVSQAWNALGSAMVGLSKPLRQYGIDVTEASLQQTALSLGLMESVRSMSRANKIGLIYITTMRQATNSMGDFARTIESPANQLRILQQQFVLLSRTVGDFFLGAISRILPYLNGVVMALTAILRTLATLMGIKVGDFASAIGGSDNSWASGLEAVEDSAEGAAKKMKQLVAPFDELNILSEDTGDSSLGDSLGGIGSMNPAIVGAMQEYNNLMDQVHMKATKIRDRLMEILGFTKHINEETGEVTWTWSFGDMITGLQSAWKDILNWWLALSPGGKLAAIFLGGWLAGVGGKFLGLLTKVILGPVLSVIGSITGTISKFTGWLGGIKWAAAFESLQPVLTTVGTWFSNLSLGGIAAFASIAAAIAAVIGAIVDLWISNAEFRDAIINDWTVIWNNVKAILQSLWNNVIMPLWQDISTFVSDVVYLFQLMFQLVWPVIKSLWGGFRDIVGGVVLSITTVLKGLTDFLAGVFTGDIDKVIKGIQELILSMFQAVLSIITGLVNVVIDALNWIIDKLNNFSISVPNWEIFGDMAGKTFGFNIQKFEHWKIPDFSGFAQGGFLDNKQIFEAGEGGKYEMIGNYKGKSTVMPLENTSFTSAMQAAVRQGVTEALMYENGLGGGSGSAVQVQVYIGDRSFDDVVYKAYNRASRTRGAKIYGGALNDGY